jgi:hypothetical protein
MMRSLEAKGDVYPLRRCRPACRCVRWRSRGGPSAEMNDVHIAVARLRRRLGYAEPCRWKCSTWNKTGPSLIVAPESHRPAFP